MRLTRLFVVLSLFCGLAVVTPARAQERTAVNSVFAEGLGPGLLYSLNYERMLERDFGLRVGVSYMSFTGSVTTSTSSFETASVDWFSVPVVASYLGVSSGANALELGLGGIFTHASGTGQAGGITSTGAGNVLWATAIVGYRRQPLNGGFMFRVGLSALAGRGLAINSNDPEAYGIVPWPYISFGSTF